MPSLPKAGRWPRAWTLRLVFRWPMQTQGGSTHKCHMDTPLFWSVIGGGCLGGWLFQSYIVDAGVCFLRIGSVVSLCLAVHRLVALMGREGLAKASLRSVMALQSVHGVGWGL